MGLTGATVAKVVPVQPARGESKAESDRVGNITAEKSEHNHLRQTYRKTTDSCKSEHNHL